MTDGERLPKNRGVSLFEGPQTERAGIQDQSVADAHGTSQAEVMGTKLSVEDAGAYYALDRLLLVQWDPIGIADVDGSDDEYRAYLPRFWELVRSGSPDAKVVEYLAEIERSRIEVLTSNEHRLDIARKAAALVAAWRLPVRR